MESGSRDEDESKILSRARKGRLRGRNELNRSVNRRPVRPSKAIKVPDESIVPFEKGWGTVKSEGIDVILDSLFEKMKQEKSCLTSQKQLELYTIVYTMCTQETPFNWSGKLYYKYTDELQYICRERFLPPLIETEDHKLLETLDVIWNSFLFALRCFHRIFAYLDRFYVRRIKVPNLYSSGIRAFHENVFHHIKEKITSAFVEAIERDRKNSKVNLQLLCKICKIFKAVGMDSTLIYELELEKPFLQETTRYMRNISSIWLDSCTCPQYLYRVRSQLKAESNRVDKYLLPMTKQKLLGVCQEQLIGERLLQIIEKKESGCAWLLRNDRTDELKTLFQLCQPVKHALIPVAKIFGTFLREIGKNIMTDAKLLGNQKTDINSSLTIAVVEMHVKYRKMLKECFGDHMRFHRALKDAFETFINMPLQLAFSEGAISPRGNISMAELVADYIDRKVRKRPTEMFTVAENHSENFLSPRTESMIERHLKQVIEIVKYLHDKDVFAEFHRKRLAKRLLLDRTSSNDVEYAIIKTLSEVCGGTMSAHCFGMLKDIKMIRDLNLDFQKHLVNTKADIGFDVSVKVLSSRHWPTYKDDSFNLPKGLTDGIQCFKEFYDLRTANRDLKWIHSLGSITIGALFNSSKFDLILNTFQASILLMFNTNKHLSLSELSENLRISEKKVYKYVSSMVSGKYKLINFSEESGRYSINEEFTHKYRKIRVPMLLNVKQKDRGSERSKSMKTISQERTHIIEAAIVRIMKAHKCLTYADLVAQTTEVLLPRFKPDASVLKSRIDDLIDRDYIEQGEHDSNKLIYVV